MQTCPPERQDPASSTRTQALVPSTRKPAQPTEPTLATGTDTKNNRNYETAACEKETPKCSKLSKMRTKKHTADEGAR